MVSPPEVSCAFVSVVIGNRAPELVLSTGEPLWAVHSVGSLRLADMLFFDRKKMLVQYLRSLRANEVDDDPRTMLSCFAFSNCNVLLHGEPGCGKTSTIHMIAQEGQFPHPVSQRVRKRVRALRL